MVFLGFKPRVAEWKAQKNPLSYGGTPTILKSVYLPISEKHYAH